MCHQAFRFSGISGHYARMVIYQDNGLHAYLVLWGQNDIAQKMSSHLRALTELPGVADIKINDSSASAATLRFIGRHGLSHISYAETLGKKERIITLLHPTVSHKKTIHITVVPSSSSCEPVELPLTAFLCPLENHPPFPDEYLHKK